MPLRETTPAPRFSSKPRRLWTSVDATSFVEGFDFHGAGQARDPMPPGPEGAMIIDMSKCRGL